MIYLRDPDAAAIREAVQTLLSNVKLASLARTIKVSRGTLYKWRGGDSAPTILELCSMATALAVHVRIDMGNLEPSEVTEDLAVMLGRVLANQERQIDMLQRVIADGT